MDVDPEEIVTVEMCWDNGGWMPNLYSRNVTRRQLAHLLTKLDELADATAEARKRTA
ncbi:hypothetical protein LE181_17845 [Streptomyces sp. SCA3-4]|uniref:hypothetical protein n=1 Tax=Streptomyces sichuanensis TaxID=2871810 RepID=UPI001CE31F05|nr:hypothetical protein [Streptomyces sichuanensis]MCA6094015.1 hypothetical protein [Streptomyces sichuanensis]